MSRHPKRSHLPVMSPKQIKNNRAVMAFWLADEAKATVGDIRAILKCKGPMEVQLLKARGRQISKQITKETEGEEMISAINYLHRGGGERVSVIHDNSGAEVVICNGNWTNWKEIWFSEQSLLAAFRLAVEAKLLAEKNGGRK